MILAGTRLLHDLRHQLLDPPTVIHPRESTNPKTVEAVA